VYFNIAEILTARIIVWQVIHDIYKIRYFQRHLSSIYKNVHFLFPVYCLRPNTEYPRYKTYTFCSLFTASDPTESTQDTKCTPCSCFLVWLPKLLKWCARVLVYFWMWFELSHLFYHNYTSKLWFVNFNIIPS
jgi:hypothetical protein